MVPPNIIVQGDVLKKLREIEDRSVHLIITSPPFNVSIPYEGYSDNLPHNEYLAWMKQVWQECYRVLVKGGRICINIDATMNLEEEGLPERVHPLHVDFTNQLREIGFIYRAELSWFKHNASGKDTCWGSYCSASNPHIRRNHEYIIVASKEDLRLEGDPMLCDLTQEEFHEWTLSTWHLTPETTKNHPAPYPRALVERCIKLFSYVGNVVLDPFCGSGTTTTTAYELGRQYIGIDQCAKYCNYARRAILRAQQELMLSGGYNFTPAPVLVKAAQEAKKNNHSSMEIDCDDSRT